MLTFSFDAARLTDFLVTRIVKFVVSLSGFRRLALGATLGSTSSSATARFIVVMTEQLNCRWKILSDAHVYAAASIKVLYNVYIRQILSMYFVLPVLAQAFSRYFDYSN